MQIELTDDQFKVIMSALEDAAVYRYDNEDPPDCVWCDEVLAEGALCSDHADDKDRANGYANLGGELRDGRYNHECHSRGPRGRSTCDVCNEPADIDGYCDTDECERYGRVAHR
jgi:hypothetical protein